MPKLTRRALIKSGTTLAALSSISAVSSPLSAKGRLRAQDFHEPSTSLIDDPNAKLLSDTALNAAREAGARFADVRLTHTCMRSVTRKEVGNTESMTFGVRALVDGFWGFAASPIWTPNEAARLARAAVANAKANTLGKPRIIELAPVTAIDDGRWVTPIIDDPFLINEDEIEDFLEGLRRFMGKIPRLDFPSTLGTFFKQDKVFASTENQFVTQRIYQTTANIGFRVPGEEGRFRNVSLDTVSPSGYGFEYLRDQPLRDEIVARYEEAKKDMELPLKPVDVGRYAMVFDAGTTAKFIHSTIGSATELDRALGEEANAGGTSYIIDPKKMLGTLKIGAPLLTITANRTEAGGAATVKWDDEGVIPEEFTLVKNGILADMQTNREGAGWLKEEYAKRNLPFKSHGCAHAPEANYAPLTRCANLQMQTAEDEATFETLIAGMSSGIAIKRGGAGMDFQQMTGYGGGEAYEVKDGKRVAEISDAAYLFRTSELWSALTAVGGRSSARRFGMGTWKGQPLQGAMRSVTAPPIAIKELSVIDKKRKA